MYGTIPEQKSHGDFAFLSWFSQREACLVLTEHFHTEFYCNTMQVPYLGEVGERDALQKGSGASREKEQKL